eukprot:PLAT7374.1.p1 GENE.PLAT7374.1~~PLAT7374.1.p1  ORF type:complete len:479 (-),score=241.90 PLAT7374.1:135-1571(-)
MAEIAPSLPTLPNDVWGNICCYLRVEDMCVLQMASAVMRTAVQENLETITVPPYQADAVKPILKLALRCPRVLRIAIYGNRITEEDVADLKAAIEHHHERLLEVRLCGDVLKDAGVESLVPTLSTVAELRHLNLSYNDMETGASLIGLLPSFRNLNVLDLSGNRMSQLDEVLLACAELPLAHLNISFCGIGDTCSFDKMAVALGQLPALETLSLTANDLAGGADVLFGAMQCMSKLQLLGLYKCGLNEAAVTALAAAMPSWPELQLIDLTQNSIDEAAMAQLKTGIAACTGLTDILLSYNALGDGGLKQLAEVLPALPALKLLGLARISAGDAGFEELASALAGAVKLETLELQRNTEPFKSLKRVMEAIAELPSLSKLDISSPSEAYDVDAAGTLGEVLAPMAALSWLNLTNCFATPDAAAAIAPLLPKSLRYVDFTGVAGLNRDTRSKMIEDITEGLSGDVGSGDIRNIRSLLWGR